MALLANPADWVAAWPYLPDPQAVEIIAVDSEGYPALDRPASENGLGKRTLGAKTGAVLILGNPQVADVDSPVRVAEGVADALALAARFPGPTIASMGDAGMTAEGFSEWLAEAGAGVVIHADNDEAGQAAASQTLWSGTRSWWDGAGCAAATGQGRRRGRRRQPVCTAD